MGTEQAVPSSSGLYGGEARGGGKFRKPPARRPPSTPYDRPPANESQAASQRPDGGWLSKLVDPTRRLIAGGATRIFPAIFSKSPSSAAEDHCKSHTGDTEGDENANYDIGSSLNFGISNSTGGTHPWKGAENLNCSSEFDQLGQENLRNLPDGSEFSRIEQMVKARTFSRDEINHLTEILSSRVADLSNVDSEEKKPNTALKREGKGAVLFRVNPGTVTEEKQEGLDGARVETLIPLPQFAVKEVVGASPVDIARAYMGSRVSEVGTDSKRIISKDKTVVLQSDGFASPLIPALPSKSSVGWPGAMVQDQYDYSTPRSSRYGLHHFQRTPFSRTIYSKSKPELTHSQADKKRHLNILSTPRLQPQTPLFGQTASFGFTNSTEKGTNSNQLCPLPNQIKGQGTTSMPSNSICSESLKKNPFQPSGRKPGLASISIAKPHMSRNIFCDSGFSFPVAAYTGVFSEPPTPSIMPFNLATSSPPQPKDGSTIPTYTFGMKRSTPALVFSFPSTSNASIPDEAPNIKYSFGSDNKKRISFRSVGKDAICY